jgi:hypothetical protein
MSMPPERLTGQRSGNRKNLCFVSKIKLGCQGLGRHPTGSSKPFTINAVLSSPIEVSAMCGLYLALYRSCLPPAPHVEAWRLRSCSKSTVRIPSVPSAQCRRKPKPWRRSPAWNSVGAAARTHIFGYVLPADCRKTPWTPCGKCASPTLRQILGA